MWKTALILVASLVLLPYLYELVLSLTVRRWRRRDYYQRAKQLAKRTGKPLLVIGDPDTGCVNHYLGRDYDCGDACLDLTGCPKCPATTRRIKGSLERWLPTLPTNGYVVFASCTLEYVADIRLVARELARVSGGDLLVASVEPSAPLHFLFRGTQRIITEAPPQSREIRWCPIPLLYRWLQPFYDPLSRPFMKGDYQFGD
jgi:hypothetical protein